MATDRLYKTTSKNGVTPKSRLIKATTKGQVAAHLVAETWEIEPASPLDVATLMAEGVKMEAAKVSE